VDESDRDWIIRPARPGEHVALSDIALRSGRHWNYTDEFMAYEPESITIAPEHITGAVTNVLELGGRALGFYVLTGEPPEMELSRMFLELDAIGTGCGRRLWEHMTETARGLDVAVIMLDADPNAEPFYLRMGAVTIGIADWEPPMMPGWRVRLMRYEIPPAGQRDQAGVTSSPDSR
jgi:GNAT superfamily N-acetyltransferase